MKATMTVCEKRVTRLTEEIRKVSCQAYIVPSQDAHDSEYVGEADKRRQWLSGFTGSVGTCVVTAEGRKFIWTDGRYFLQAEKELDTSWTIMRMGLPDTPTIGKWLKKNTTGIVGVDGFTTSSAFHKAITEEVGNDRVRILPENLVDIIWNDKPRLATHQLSVQPEYFTGMSAAQKIASIRVKMLEKDADLLVVSGLAEIAWTLNLRGCDIPYTPVFLSYLFVPREGSPSFFVDSSKLSDQVLWYLKVNGVSQIEPYERAVSNLRDEVAKKNGNSSEKIWVDPSCNIALFLEIPKSRQLQSPNPIALMKAVKSTEEAKGAINAHIRDGLAKSRFLHWLEEVASVDVSGVTYSEVDLADKLESFRKEQANFRGLSFPSISSIGSNGAVIHYKPERGSAKFLTSAKGESTIYLIDSGAQYTDGTTDVTRTVHLGGPNSVPSHHEKKCFTLVLKGHIQLALAVFPNGCSGHQLDILARQALWKNGLDYLHGTGHGVGSFLGVHEGPMSISTRYCSTTGPVPLKPGMILSNEPGYYEDGKFGVRIENLVLVVEKPSVAADAMKPFYGFKNLTLIPIQKKLICQTMLTNEEIQYIDTYHQEIYDTLGPLCAFESETNFNLWLKAACAPLSPSILYDM